jgi:hypothetical protein
MKYFYFKVAFAVFLLLIVRNWENAHAIPAFARKYQISCQVCHSPAIPRLKGFGEEFSGNGFRMADYESPRYFVPTGDDKLSLFRELPLAIRLDGFASYNFDKGGSFDVGSPFVLKILSGGELSDKLSYYFYFLLNERGTIAGVEDAILIYNNLFGSGINFTIGQFQASDPLFKSETRLTLEPYRIFDAKPGNSLISLRYERGIILDKGFSTGTTLYAMVVNGSGIGEASEGWVFDIDKHKNFMGHITQSLGGNLGIGFFAYTGREDLPGHFNYFENDVLMFGPDLKLNLDEKFILNLQYVRRTDSDVFTGPSNLMLKNIMSQGGFAEIIFSPKGDMSNWYLTGLINLVDSDIDEIDYRAATIHAGYLLRRNIKFVTEFTSIFSHTSYGKVSAGFVSAF